MCADVGIGSDRGRVDRSVGDDADVCAGLATSIDQSIVGSID